MAVFYTVLSYCSSQTVFFALACNSLITCRADLLASSTNIYSDSLLLWSTYYTLDIVLGTVEKNPEIKRK